MATMSPEDFSRLIPLSANEHQLIGHYIQTYNFIDFNLRRSIELFWHAKMLPQERVKKYPKFTDADLPLIVAQIVEGMDPGAEEIERSLGFLKQIELGRPYRNLMGHFAAKRMGQDLIVFASKDERDAERLFGRRLKKGHVAVATTTVKAIHDLTSYLVTASDWLAFRFPEWFTRYDKT